MMDPENRTVCATSVTMRTLVDGTLRMSVDIDMEYAIKAMTAMCKPGTPLFISLMSEEVARKVMAEGLTAECNEKPKEQVVDEGPNLSVDKELTSYGSFYRPLFYTTYDYQELFLNSPQVLNLAGSDSSYQAWCRLQSHCAFHPEKDTPQDYDMDSGRFRVEYAHENDAANSGTGYKNKEYAGYPTCSICHRKYHNNGKDEFEGFNIPKIIKKYNAAFAKEKIVSTFFHIESLKYVQPERFIEWAKALGVFDLLPPQMKQELSK